MRRIGVEEVKSPVVEWRVGTGEKTGLLSNSVDLFAMGSSFNTTDRLATLAEAARVLRAKGFFACMWNHRDLNDETQRKSEQILKEFFFDYSHGTRRENQSDLLNASSFFKDLHFIESTQEIHQKIDDYIAAWKSVKNKFWDLASKEGQELFGKIEQRMRAELPAVQVLHYTTRIWIVQKT
jgi:ubiquinone/menaquinone biosynthesis C-methylase UbiE